MASIGRNNTYKWPVSVYADVNAAKRQVIYLRKLNPSFLQEAEGRSYIVKTTPIHYYLARRSFTSLTAEPPTEDVDSNAEDALEETYETTKFHRTYLPDMFQNGKCTTKDRPCRTYVDV